MSIAEIKEEAVRLGGNDVVHLAAWFHHLARRKEAAYLQSLDDVFDGMDTGNRVSLEEYKRLSHEMDQSGL